MLALSSLRPHRRTLAGEGDGPYSSCRTTRSCIELRRTTRSCIIGPYYQGCGPDSSHAPSSHAPAPRGPEHRRPPDPLRPRLLLLDAPLVRVPTKTTYYVINAVNGNTAGKINDPVYKIKKGLICENAANGNAAE